MNKLAIIKTIRDLVDKFLRIPELRGFSKEDFDGAEYVKIQKEVYNKKKVLRLLYNGYCQPFVKSASRASESAVMVEIGSGSSPLKEKLPYLISTELIFCDWCDVVCSAAYLPFKEKSLDRLFLMFVCHHLSRLDLFLYEAKRCLKPGGEIVIIDSAITFFSKFYYKYIHVDNIDIETKNWHFDGKGRLSCSNVALPWIVFIKGRERFKREHPEFEITDIEYTTCLSFLLSGGLRIRQLLPTAIIVFIFKVENWIICNFSKEIAVTMVLTLRKKNTFDTN